jgi:septal ring-binding cell division protein DamX
MAQNRHRHITDSMSLLLTKKMRRYRAYYPQSHRAFFYLIEACESLLKIVLVCAFIAGCFLLLKDRMPLINAATGKTDNTQTARGTPGQFQPALSRKPKESTRNGTETRYAGILNSEASVEWLIQLKPSEFIIQFATTPDKPAIIAFATENLSTSGAAVYPFKRTPSGRYVYGVSTIEVYKSLESAQLALGKLPPALQQSKPWIRPVKALQEEVLKTL